MPVTISSYSRLEPFPVTDEGKVLELFKNLVSDAEIHFVRKDVVDEVLLGFWAEDAVYWDNLECPITDFLELLRPYVKPGFAAVYKEIKISQEGDGEVAIEAFSWIATRDSLSSISIDDLAPGIQSRFDALLFKK